MDETTNKIALLTIFTTLGYCTYDLTKWSLSIINKYGVSWLVLEKNGDDTVIRYNKTLIIKIEEEFVLPDSNLAKNAT